MLYHSSLFAYHTMRDMRDLQFYANTVVCIRRLHLLVVPNQTASQIPATVWIWKNARFTIFNNITYGPNIFRLLLSINLQNAIASLLAAPFEHLHLLPCHMLPSSVHADSHSDSQTRQGISLEYIPYLYSREIYNGFPGRRGNIEQKNNYIENTYLTLSFWHTIHHICASWLQQNVISLKKKKKKEISF